MGLFKQMKDMKATVEAAPGMISQAQQMGAQAQEMAAAQRMAAQQAMAQQTAVAAQPGAAGLEPIAGVSLEQYADISRGLAAYGYDQSKAVEVAASKGVPADQWQQAMDGWNARMRSDPSIARRFNALYTGR